MGQQSKVIRVPFGLVEVDKKTKHALAVYIVVACKAAYAVHDKMTTKLSLLDIIYTIGLTPKAGKGRVNDQIAIAVKTLRDLGYFEDAPDFIERGRLDMKRKYRYKVVVPTEIGSYVTITSNDIYKVAQATRDSEKKLTFSYDVALRVLFTIKWKVIKNKSRSTMLSREKISEIAGVSVGAVTAITNVLASNDVMVIKKWLHWNGDKHAIAVYANCYDKKSWEHINESIKHYESHIGT